MLAWQAIIWKLGCKNCCNFGIYPHSVSGNFRAGRDVSMGVSPFAPGGLVVQNMPDESNVASPEVVG
jgi:hypothetical protein